MRYFFHIVDKYGLSPDRSGSEHADRDAALLHAERIAAELAKTGEFFGPSFVLVGGVAVAEIDVRSQQRKATSVADALQPETGKPISCPCSLQRIPDLRA
jgi:hypothetical protein